METNHATRPKDTVSGGCLTGRKIGFLKVGALSSKSTTRRTYYTCQCDCGATVDVNGYRLSKEMTLSCGQFSCRSKSMPQGGLANKHRSTYMAWSVICRSPANVAREWQGNFLGFLDTLGPRPEGTFLRKIDKTGIYRPGNCYWGK